MPEQLPTLIRFRLADERLQQSLANRSRAEGGDSESLTARRDLERYYALLDRERRTLAGAFSVPEFMLLLDSSNAVLYEAHTMQYLADGVADSIQLDGLAGKWQVDGPALIATLRSLTPGQTWALVDALERRWLDTDHQQDAAAMMAVGIVPSDGS